MEDNLEAISEKIKATISEYERLLEIIGNEPGTICRMPKTEISRLYGKSYTGTLKKLGFLERYGLIEKTTGGYVRTEKIFMRDTPFSLIPRIVLLLSERPELFNSYKQQAEVLSVSLSEIQTAWGFLSYFFGSVNSFAGEMKVTDLRG
ncbi:MULTISPECIES: hypothetical protein [unclassified Paenibacillus]|uniref:hypothetical protein n=1 Tax=unclassified Paenibacillus TaxID=185978 RepID=UPI001AEAB65D|nr:MULTISPECIES: hypothetical protein [unclassified Paenibacillus]MBP1153935.1 hypothetical protein [Paenibacillus sp. PvP091]MBP1170680.1 hypothetical protein [Paenibacillus sp. PvR098]MBP2441708.1 hypothetical protein [Paenibacillus sp. PvP052]